MKLYEVIVKLVVLLSQTLQSQARKTEGKQSDVTATISKKDSIHSTLDPHTTSMTQQIERLFRSHNYEMSVSPAREGEPVQVGVAVMIESISDISEVNMDFTITLRIWKTWTDRRLRLKGEHESIVLPSRLIDKLWVPDLYIVGSKKSFIHRTTVDNIMLRLFKNGTICYRAKITTTVACQMNLYNFPLDIENCTLAVQSLAYTKEELELEWWMGETTEELFMDSRLVSNMPKFKLVHHRLHTNVVFAKQGGGEVYQLQVSFELQRYLLSVFFQSYFPAIIMVILAGLGMWLDPRSVPARVAMGITSVLTISTIITGLKSSLPKVSYLTAMDLYLWTCFLFVFSTVLEYCVLNYIMTLEIRKKKGNDKEINRNESKKNSVYQKYRMEFLDDHTKTSRFTGEETNQNGIYQRKPSSLHQRQSSFPSSRSSGANQKMFDSPRRALSALSNKMDATKLDVFFRLFYFLSFIVFNAVYWTYYVIATRHGLNDE